MLLSVKRLSLELTVAPVLSEIPSSFAVIVDRVAVMAAAVPSARRPVPLPAMMLLCTITAVVPGCDAAKTPTLLCELTLLLRMTRRIPLPLPVA